MQAAHVYVDFGVAALRTAFQKYSDAIKLNNLICPMDLTPKIHLGNARKHYKL